MTVALSCKDRKTAILKYPRTTISEQQPQSKLRTTITRQHNIERSPFSHILPTRLANPQHNHAFYHSHPHHARDPHRTISRRSSSVRNLPSWLRCRSHGELSSLSPRNTDHLLILNLGLLCRWRCHMGSHPWSHSSANHRCLQYRLRILLCSLPCRDLCANSMNGNVEGCMGARGKQAREVEAVSAKNVGHTCLAASCCWVV